MGRQRNSINVTQIIIVVIFTLILCNLISCTGGKFSARKKTVPKSAYSYLTPTKGTTNTNFDYFLKLLNTPFEWLNPFAKFTQKIQKELNDKQSKSEQPKQMERPIASEYNYKYLLNNPELQWAQEEEQRERKHIVQYRPKETSTLNELHSMNASEDFEIHFPIIHLANETVNPTKSYSKRETTSTHKPITYSPTECHSRGKKVGDLMNICARQDCTPSKLRCPPSYDLLPPSQFFSANLSTCHVEELVCMDERLTFNDWEQTEILELICANGEIVGPDGGALDHCSVITLKYFHEILNFTYTTDDSDTKCYVDVLDCPDYCTNIEVKCNNQAIECDFDHFQCIDGFIQCNQTPVMCNNRKVLCEGEKSSQDDVIDDTSPYLQFGCGDNANDCSNFEVNCNNVNPCSFYVMNSTYPQGLWVEYEPQCNEDRLITCNDSIVWCNNAVVHCSDSSKVKCKDAQEKYQSYYPTITCNDNLTTCTEYTVKCDGLPLSCDPGYSWHFNETFDDQPFCLLDNYYNSNYYDPNNYAKIINQYNQYNDDIKLNDNEYDDNNNINNNDLPPYVLANRLCRLGVVTSYCSLNTCDDLSISCSNGENMNCDQNLVIDDSADIPIALCNNYNLVCLSEPPCPINRRQCRKGESCAEVLYECADDQPNDCKYNSYSCEDACWLFDGNSTCVCPIDYYGSSCQTARPYLCNFTLIDPTPQCEPFPSPFEKLTAFPVCLLASVNDYLILNYTMHCEFIYPSPSVPPIEEDPRVNFDYFARRGNEFASSSQLNVKLSVFNFNHLSDTSASLLRPLSPSQTAYDQPFYFPLNISSIYTHYKDKFFYGGRLYIETDLYAGGFGKYLKGMYLKQPNRQFIDFVDYEVESEKLPLSDFELFVTYLLYNPQFLLAPLLVILGVYFTVHFWKNKDKN